MRTCFNEEYVTKQVIGIRLILSRNRMSDVD